MRNSLAALLVVTSAVAAALWAVEPTPTEKLKGEVAAYVKNGGGLLKFSDPDDEAAIKAALKTFGFTAAPVQDRPLILKFKPAKPFEDEAEYAAALKKIARIQGVLTVVPNQATGLKIPHDHFAYRYQLVVYVADGKRYVGPERFGIAKALPGADVLSAVRAQAAKRHNDLPEFKTQAIFSITVVPIVTGLTPLTPEQYEIAACHDGLNVVVGQ